MSYLGDMFSMTPVGMGYNYITGKNNDSTQQKATDQLNSSVTTVGGTPVDTGAPAWATPYIAGGSTQMTTGGTKMLNPYLGSGAPSYMQTQVGPASQAGYVTGLNGQAGQAQSSLLNQLAAQAQGKGPSLATLQLQQGLDQNVRSQLAMAGASRNGGLAQYNAGQNAAGSAQAMSGQAAMARAQEQLNAQGALMGLTGQMQNNALNNAQLQQQINLANMGASNEFALEQAKLNQNSNQFYNNMMANQANAYNSYLQSQALNYGQNDEQMRQKEYGAMWQAGSAGLQQGAGMGGGTPHGAGGGGGGMGGLS